MLQFALLTQIGIPVGCLSAGLHTLSIHLPGTSEVVIYGIDVVRYYFYLFQNFFAGYPWVVQVSYSIVLMCVCGIFVLFLSMLWDIYHNSRRDRFFKRIMQDYYEPLKVVCEDYERLPISEIEHRIHYKETKWKKWQMWMWVRLFIHLRVDTFYFTPHSNIHRAASMVGLPVFLEEQLKYGPRRNKLKLLQVMQFIQIAMPESVLVRLLNDRDRDLRKSSRIYYMSVSDDDPYRFFEEDHGVDYRPLDKLELHQLFEDRCIAEKVVPSFIPLLPRIVDEGMRAFLIREVAYWGSDEDMRRLYEYFGSKELRCRKAALEAMGVKRFAESEDLLMKQFYENTEPLRRTILHAVFDMETGRAVDFFKQAYADATSNYTKRVALRCLFLYGEEGRAAFYDLKNYTIKEERILFEHVENPIINNDDY